MKQPKLTLTQIIDKTLIEIIKNIEPNLIASIREKLLNRVDITSVKKCEAIVRQSMLTLPGVGRGGKKYWLSRGWDETSAEIKSKIHMKDINSKTKRNSPYSINFWTKKINPKTGTSYTSIEAEFERNSRRPIRKEYWIKKGYDENSAMLLAENQKKSNDNLGAKNSKNRNVERIRAHSHRTIEYWILRGYSNEEAKLKVSEAQTLFSQDTCIKKYGEKQGLKIWSERQIKWLSSLKKSGLHGGFSKVSLELFESILPKVPNIHFGVDEVVLQVDNMSYSIDCISFSNKKIIEFYGDYWHANPNKFKATDIIKKITAEKIWEKDHKKIKSLENNGYTVLIIWESDYKKDKQETINKCIHFLTQ